MNRKPPAADYHARPRDRRSRPPGPAGRAPGPALAPGPAAVRRPLGAARRCARRRDAGELDPASPRGQGRRQRAVPPRAAGDPRRPGERTRDDGLPRARSRRNRPDRAGRHRMALGRPAADDGLRPRGVRARRPRPAAGEALVHESRLRPGAGDVHRLGAARRSTRSPWATRSRRPTCSACCCAAACSSPRASAGRLAARAVAPPRSSASGRPTSRSPTSSRCCALRLTKRRPEPPGADRPSPSPTRGSRPSRERPPQACG